MVNDFQDIDFLFHPRSIALVGVSTDPANPMTDMFLMPLLGFGFEGPVYPTVAQAANAINKFIEYQERRQSL